MAFVAIMVIKESADGSEVSAEWANICSRSCANVDTRFMIQQRWRATSVSRAPNRVSRVSMQKRQEVDR